MDYKKLYEELAERLVGIDATERYSHEDILSYIHNLKNIEERFYEVKTRTKTKTWIYIRYHRGKVRGDADRRVSTKHRGLWYEKRFFWFAPYD